MMIGIPRRTTVPMLAIVNAVTTQSVFPKIPKLVGLLVFEKTNDNNVLHGFSRKITESYKTKVDCHRNTFFLCDRSSAGFKEKNCLFKRRYVSVGNLGIRGNFLLMFCFIII